MKLCLLFLTYNRPQYAERCLRAALENIVFDGEVHVHIADDGSPSGYVDRLRAIAGGFSGVHSVGVSCSDRRGYGANYNLATQHIHSWADFVLPLEDDWVLTEKLDVGELVQVFQDTRIGCLRLGYLGFTQDVSGELLRAGRSGQVVMLLNPTSGEPHLFAGHPRLETVEWERWAGAWPEGLDPNVTEFMVAHQVRNGIAWPLWLHPDGGLFAHIGTERVRD